MSPGPTGSRMADLAWLASTELRNRMASMAGRLTSPRYLIAAAVGVAYFVLTFAPILFAERGGEVAPPPWALGIAPLVLAALALFWWIRGGYQEALAFRPAEVNLLFTAPIGRRTLIQYKLLRAQAGVLVSACVIAFMRPSGIPWLLALLGAWVIVTTLHLHQLGSSLVRVTAAERGAGLRRAAVPLAMAAALGAVLLWTVGRVILGARQATTPHGVLAALQEALSSPVTEAALLPFTLLLAPAFATGMAEWAVGMAGAVGLLVLHLMWVLKSQAAFEEVAAEAGQRRADAIAAIKEGRSWGRAGRREEGRVRRWIRIPLSPAGEPALALAWSHLVSFLGEIRPTTIAVLAAGLAAMFAVLAWAGGSVAAGASGLAALLVFFGVAALLMGPLALRYDLRRDLGRIEVLRTFPLDPRWVVVAEIAAPVILLLGVELIVLALWAVLLPLSGAGPGLLQVALPLALLAVVNAPGLLALQVAVQNALALYLPGWVQIGGPSRGGIDAVGQGVISVLVAMMAFLVLLLLPTLAALVIGASFSGILGRWAVIPGAVVFTGAVWLQVAWLVDRLARAYERLDPAEAGLLR